MNARDYLTSKFIKKADLRASGPQRLTIKAVEPAEGLPGRNGKRPCQELQLVFTDDRRYSRCGHRSTCDACSKRSATRPTGGSAETIELYFNPDVTNPSGGEPAGIRLRVPEPAPRARPLTYRNELDGELFESKPALPEPGAEETHAAEVPEGGGGCNPFES